MAKTQVNIGMFERAGRASGQANLSEAGYKAPYDYSKGFTDSMKRASEATAAAKKTADLLKKNPNGVEIPKLTEAANQQVTDYLITKKPEIAAAHQVLRTGTDEEKLEATEFLNKVDKGVQQLNADFENAATKQAELLDMSSSGGYANSNTANQSLNFNDMANGHMIALVPPNYINSLWFDVRDHLAPAIDRSHGRWSNGARRRERYAKVNVQYPRC